MSGEMERRSPGGEIVLYQTADGKTRVECRFDEGTIWLTQALIAALFQPSVPNINLHIKNIVAEGELPAETTVKDYIIARSEGSRQVERPVKHYNLVMILAVGYRVRSPRGTQFRRWATARLEEYLRKGFVLDDERLKNPPGPGVPDYFDELLGRIRDTRYEMNECRSAMCFHRNGFQPSSVAVSAPGISVRRLRRWPTRRALPKRRFPNRLSAS
jgi:hypothetical protein